jgi:hypothetical protein
MKTTVYLDSLHLKLRGVPVATAAAAVHGLGPVLTSKLTSDAATPGTENSVHVPRDASAASLRDAIATRVAGALRAHFPSNQR